MLRQGRARALPFFIGRRPLHARIGTQATISRAAVSLSFFPKYTKRKSSQVQVSNIISVGISKPSLGLVILAVELGSVQTALVCLQYGGDWTRAWKRRNLLP